MASQSPRHPYLITSAAFVLAAVLGARLLGWGDGDLAFLVLLYFIAVLGIKLDEISKELRTANAMLARLVRCNPVMGRDAEAGPGRTPSHTPASSDNTG